MRAKILRKAGDELPFREIKSAVYCEFKKGESLISEGEEVHYVYYLTDGIVKRMQVDNNGCKRTIEKRAPWKSLCLFDKGFFILALLRRQHL